MTQMIITYIDDTGFALAPTNGVNSTSDAITLANTIKGYTAARLDGLRVVQVLTPPGYSGLASAYPSVADVADLWFTANGRSAGVRLTIPAPLDTIFLGDQETVDPSAIGPLIADCISLMQAPSGENIVAYRFGKRRRLTLTGRG